MYFWRILGSVVVLGLGLGLEPKSLALAKQVLGLVGLVICQTNNTVTVTNVTKPIQFFFILAARRGYLLLNCVLKYRFPQGITL